MFLLRIMMMMMMMMRMMLFILMMMMIMMIMMIMMMMTLMKLVNSGTKIRPELTSFTNRIRVCAVPRGRTRLYIHICVYLDVINFKYIISSSPGARPGTGGPAPLRAAARGWRGGWPPPSDASLLPTRHGLRHSHLWYLHLHLYLSDYIYLYIYIYICIYLLYLIYLVYLIYLIWSIYLSIYLSI